MPPARLGSVWLLVGCVATAASADVSLPGNHPGPPRATSPANTTIWPTVSYCASGVAKITAVGLTGGDTLTWSNDRGDHVRLTAAQPTAFLSPGLRRNLPTHLANTVASYAAHFNVTCQSAELWWHCKHDEPICERQVELPFEPGVREHYEDRKKIVARAMSHWDEARNLVIDKVLASLPDICAHARCSDVVLSAAARLRAVRAGAPWQRGYEDDLTTSARSANRVDDVGCHPVGCDLSIGNSATPDWLNLEVDALDGPDYVRLQAHSWLLVVGPLGIHLGDDAIR